MGPGDVRVIGTDYARESARVVSRSGQRRARKVARLERQCRAWSVRFNEEAERARDRRNQGRRRASALITAGRLQRRRERRAAGLERIAQTRAAILARRAA